MASRKQSKSQSHLIDMKGMTLRMQNTDLQTNLVVDYNSASEMFNLVDDIVNCINQPHTSGEPPFVLYDILDETLEAALETCTECAERLAFHESFSKPQHCGERDDLIEQLLTGIERMSGMRVRYKVRRAGLAGRFHAKG